MNMRRLNTWEKKILKRVCGPMVDQGIWRRRSNQELRELRKDLYIVADYRVFDQQMHFFIKSQTVTMFV